MIAAVAVVDYGAGNLTSVLKGLRAAGASPIVTCDPSTIAAADAIVIPGVGNFAATSAIAADVRDALRRSAEAGRPMLGICLGLQFLFEGSAEAPGARGLGLLSGECSLLPPTDGVKIPHVGWNTLSVTRRSALLEGIEEGAQVYFTHSYAAPVTDATVAACTHGISFAAVVERDNVFGVQFHPEKSGDTGMRILRTFVGRC